MSKRSGKRRKTAAPLTAAGLIRFYEESDVGIRVKPHILILLALAVSVAVIVLQKALPMS